jgi:transcriptional regulator with XRE-family HTH domain
MRIRTARSLGDTIKARRKEFGWSQAEFAERVATHGDWTFGQSDVSRLERGNVSLPRRERLVHIAAVLGYPLGELLVRSGWVGADEVVSDEGRARSAQRSAPRDRWRDVQHGNGSGLDAEQP